MNAQGRLNAMIEADNRIVVCVNQTQTINPASTKKLQPTC